MGSERADTAVDFGRTLGRGTGGEGGNNSGMKTKLLGHQSSENGFFLSPPSHPATFPSHRLLFKA